MSHFFSTISQHAYLLVFLVVLAEAIGLPVPAALALIATGAAVASHAMSAPAALGIALAAIMIGDLLLFLVGRYTGWALLAGLCRLSLNPESCILRSAESFYKHGKITLLFAKFIPGVNTMAPPLAGSMRMRTSQFVQLDFVGATLYTLAYFMIGFVFRDFVARITRGLQTAGHAAAEVVAAAIVVFIVYRIVKYRQYKLTDVAPRVEVGELARRLAEKSGDVLIADVRSHGYYDSGAARIAGSVRLEPNQLAEELKSLSHDKDIFLYCT